MREVRDHLDDLSTVISVYQLAEAHLVLTLRSIEPDRCELSCTRNERRRVEIDNGYRPKLMLSEVMDRSAQEIDSGASLLRRPVVLMPSPLKVSPLHTASGDPYRAKTAPKWTVNN